MELGLLIGVVVISLIILVLLFRLRGGGDAEKIREIRSQLDFMDKNLGRIETAVKDEIKQSREELNAISKENRQELTNSMNNFQATFLAALNGISKNQLDQLKNITESNQQALAQLGKTIEDKINALLTKTDDNNKANREELTRNLREFQESFDKNVKSFNDLQREKFSELDKKHSELVSMAEQKLEKMRETVDEKLQKTLEARLGQSFELVSKQLESVQKGLGEMQTLAQDVGGLKKVLSNVKMRGGIGEVQLGMLLEQMLAPEQYEANVRTKKGSDDIVEYAIRLPGKDDVESVVYMPIDAKFPKDAYDMLVDAYEAGEPGLIDSASKNLEVVIRKMAKDIRDKYIDPPNTTDFGIMFLPFEGIYAEVIRRSTLMEQLQRDFKIVVTGPTTLAAMLNSLQMGFKTLAIQKRSSEVWQVLSAVKTEFEKFGGILDKAQKNLTTASSQLEEVIGKRTRAIQRRLRGVETLPAAEVKKLLPELNEEEEEAGEEEEEESKQ